MDAYHGTAGSPLLYKDRVILYQDQFARVVHRRVRHAHRQASCGARRATRNVGWGTPIAVRVGDHDEIIVNGQQRVSRYNPDTGAELWSCGGMTTK